MYMITIDGPASSGKSTVAGLVAQQLNITHVNSGQGYRAIAYLMLGLDISPDQIEEVKQALNNNKFQIVYDKGRQRVFVNDVDVTSKLHTNRISGVVAQYAVIPEVIYKASDMIKDITSVMSVVIEGRNLGSFCFPHARYKFYVDCEPKIRAERRYKELLDKGESVNFETIYQQVLERDRVDRNRKVAPLKVPERSVLIDSSYQTPQQVADTIVNIVLDCEQSVNP